MNKRILAGTLIAAALLAGACGTGAPLQPTPDVNAARTSAAMTVVAELTLPSGLQYKILKAAEGKKPTAEDEVEVRYRGTLINGKEFDSSGSETRTFKLAQVIPGWREALQLMPAGSKWQLVVPPELAYGERGMGQVIMPNSTLIFEVELVGIKPAEAKAPEAAKPPEAEAPKK